MNFCAKASVHRARLALFLVIAVILHTDAADAQTVQDAIKLSVDDPRPVAAAVQELVSRYGYVITYEDPRHAYQGDIQDVTTQVRKDLDQYSPGKAPKAMVPLGGTLTLTIPSSSSISTQAVASVLEQLMRVQLKRGEGGHFRVVQAGDVFHVLPTEVRDRSGNWAVQPSILDVPISLPMEDRDEDGMLNAICNAVSVAAHVKVFLGAQLGGLGRHYRLGADNERARDVLMRAVMSISSNNQKLTWQLFYGSSENMYALNIQGVPERPSSSVVTGVPKTSTGSSLSGTSVSPLKK
jgi:hypothetical protein